MKNSIRISLGITITAFIFILASLIRNQLSFGIQFVPDFTITLSLEIFFSALAIWFCRKVMQFQISSVRLLTLLKPFAIGLGLTILINGIFSVAIKLTGGTLENPENLMNLRPIQIFLFVFLYASVAEELLFRGFLLNYLKPLENFSFTIGRLSITLPVVVSGLMFGLSHLILLFTGASILFLIRIVFFTTVLGIVSGYYQEKYHNFIYAIVVHMSGNLLALFASLSLQ